MKINILAVIVTFNPNETLSINVEKISQQVDDVLIIDNGSSNINEIREVAEKHRAFLVENGVNKGIAAGLNQAALIAFERKKDALWTFDQDSLIPNNCLSDLLEFWRGHPERDKVGIICVQHKDRATHAEYHHKLDIIREYPGWRILRSTITSGSLVFIPPLSTANIFDESLFIDAVDHDFCLRIRRQGWMIVEMKGIYIEHSIGQAAVHHILGRKFVSTNHSALRRYYIARNGLEVFRRNIFFDPLWSFKSLLMIFSGVFSALIYEKEKWPKIKFSFLGVSHFFMRRFGRRL